MIKLFVVHSLLESEEQAKERYAAIVNSIADTFDEITFAGYINTHEKIDKQFYLDGDGIIILVASGGSEEFIAKIIRQANLPALICANSEFNSLAASLETYSFLKNKYMLTLFYWSNPGELLERIKNFSRVCGAVQKINQAKIGLIGEPSDWLLTSKGIESFGKFKTILAKFGTEKLIKEITRTMSGYHESSVESNLHFGKIKVDKSALDDSLIVHAAVRNFAAKHNLDGLTIRCFDLLKNNYTACIAIALCNDEGIISGCEGDLHAMFSMMLGFYLTGEPCWMANPASVDKENNSVTFAHCTAPIKFLDQSHKMDITTHMESGLSCAIEGSIKKEPVTIFRTGENFNKLIAVKGNVIETGLHNPAFCRTQAVIKLSCGVDIWMNNTFGNHQVIVYGDISNLLSEFCGYTGVEFFGL